MSGGWTGGLPGPAQLPKCQPALPSASPTWVLGALSSLEREGVGRSSRGRRPGAGTRSQPFSRLPGIALQPLPRAVRPGCSSPRSSPPRLPPHQSENLGVGLGGGRGGCAPRLPCSRPGPRPCRGGQSWCLPLGASSGVTKKIKLVNDKDRIFHALGAGPDDLENELKWIQPPSLL